MHAILHSRSILPGLAAFSMLGLVAYGAGAARADTYEVTFLKGRSDDDGAYRRAKIAATLTPRDGKIGLIRAGADTGLYHQWATFLLNIEAVDSDGNALEIEYEPHGLWRLPGWSEGPVSLRYTMALQHDRFPNEPGDNELADATSYGVLWTGRALFMEGAISDDVQVTFNAPEGWRVTTPWQDIDPTGLAFAPRNTDDLLDSAFFAGTHDELAINVEGVEARIATGPDMAAERTIYQQTLETYLAAYENLFDAPTADTPVIIGVRGSFWGGGVMGRSISLTHGGEMNPAIAPMLIYIMAHETFHLWNGQWRYDDELRPPIEWMAEGTAEYYTILTGARTGGLSPDLLLGQIAERWATYRNALDDKSIAAAGYTKLKDQQSYDLVYSGGMMTSLALDLMIRRETNHAKSFDEAIRVIHRRFSRPQKTAMSKSSVIAAIRHATGMDASGFFAHYLHKPNVLPVMELLQSVGVCLAEHEGDGEWTAEAARCPNPTPAQDRAWALWIGGNPP